MTRSPPDATRLVRATDADVTALVAFVRAYHEGDGIESDPAALPAVLRPLLADSTRTKAAPDDDAAKGRIWFIEHAGATVGYVAVCFGYSIEFRGVDAFVDEIYLAPAVRGRGIGAQALQLAIDAVRALGVPALHLEVDPDNAAAVRLYRRAGFAERRYRLMSRVFDRAARR